MAPNESNVQPTGEVGAVIGHAGDPTFVTYYDDDNNPVQLPAEKAEEMAAKLGLREHIYDIEASYARWQAAIDAKRDAVDRSVRECLLAGVALLDPVEVMNAAAGEEHDAYRELGLAIGVRLPSEPHVKDVAAHKQLLGEVSPGFRGLKRAEEAADRLIERDPDGVAKHIEYSQEQTEASKPKA